MNALSFFKNYFDAAEEMLTAEEQKNFFYQIIRYAFTGEESELTTKASRALWMAVKPSVDKSRNNAGRGGRPRKETEDAEEIKTDGFCEEENRRISPDAKPNTFLRKEKKEKEKRNNNIRARAREGTQKDAPVDTRNRFNRFPQQEYDFDEIKQKLARGG